MVAMTRVLSDDDVARLDPAHAVGWMLDALRMRAAGDLVSPVRLRAGLGRGDLVVTPGQSPRWYGYRSYDTEPTTDGQQVVVAHDARTGLVAAIHVGNDLGAARTGALGGAAAALLGPSTACTVAVLGAGRQAWWQVWALSAVLDIGELRVVSRTHDSAERLAGRAIRELGLSAHAVPEPRDAVSAADVVVLATNSSAPVIDPAWLRSDVFVTTVGPKQQGRAEFGLDLLEGAAIVATDSIDQLHAYDPPALVAAAGQAGGVTDLSLVASGVAEAPHRGRRVYLSVGLSGTEVHLLGHLSELAL